MRHDFIDHHSYQDSLIHRLDPRAKTLMSVLFVVAVVTVGPGRYFEFGAMALVLLLLIRLSQVSVGHIIGKSLKVAPFILIIAAFLPFLKPGTPLWEARLLVTVRVTREGLLLFVNILMKSYLAILCMVFLTATTPFPLLLKGLEGLRLPRIVTMILSFMYRYIFLMVDEAERLLTAREARRTEMGWWLSFKSLTYVIGVLIIRTYERAERVYDAMCSRGFDGNVVTLEDLHWRRADALAGLALVTIVLVVRILGGFYV